MKPIPEDWDRAVAVVAHPDDLEYGVASAVARWTRQGKQVSYLLVTRGEAGIAGMPPDKVAPLRVEEERRSAAVVGVTEVEFLDPRLERPRRAQFGQMSGQLAVLHAQRVQALFLFDFLAPQLQELILLPDIANA